MLGHVLHMMCGQPVYISVVDVCFRENEEIYDLHSAACIFVKKNTHHTAMVLKDVTIRSVFDKPKTFKNSKWGIT